MSDQLAINFARGLRDEGMERSAEAAAEEFREVGARIVAELAASGEPFNADDLRDRLEEHGVPVDRPNAVGSLFMQASRRGLIQRVGYRQTVSPSQHAHTHPLWQGVA